MNNVKISFYYGDNISDWTGHEYNRYSSKSRLKNKEQEYLYNYSYSPGYISLLSTASMLYEKVSSAYFSYLSTAGMSRWFHAGISDTSKSHIDMWCSTPYPSGVMTVIGKYDILTSTPPAVTNYKKIKIDVYTSSPYSLVQSYEKILYSTVKTVYHCTANIMSDIDLNGKKLHYDVYLGLTS